MPLGSSDDFQGSAACCLSLAVTMTRTLQTTVYHKRMQTSSTMNNKGCITFTAQNMRAARNRTIGLAVVFMSPPLVKCDTWTICHTQHMNVNRNERQHVNLLPQHLAGITCGCLQRRSRHCHGSAVHVTDRGAMWYSNQNAVHTVMVSHLYRSSLNETEGL